jgi:hypothetical protein
VLGRDSGAKYTLESGEVTTSRKGDAKRA